MKSQIDPFHAIGVSALARRLEAEGRSVLHMEFGQPSSGAPRSALALAPQILASDSLGYWESAPLRTRLSAHYREAYRVAVDPERILMTAGASGALVLALTTLFDPGDRIAFARPGYSAYRNTVRALNMVPVEIPCGPDTRFQLTAAALRVLNPAPAGIIVASPANPTGAILPAAELAAIAEICRERGIRIISDEIYHGLSYTEPCRSMLEFEPDSMVINSFSKYFCMPGWRLGWLVTPEALVTRARALQGCLFLTAGTLAQHVALAAMDAREELDEHLKTYARNRELLLDALPRMGLGSIAPPDGAFYIYADISTFTDDSLAFCKRLLRDTGVAAGPGIDFDPDLGRRFIRLSFALSTPQVEEAIARLGPWFQRQAELRAPGEEAARPGRPQD